MNPSPTSDCRICSRQAFCQAVGQIVGECPLFTMDDRCRQNHNIDIHWLYVVMEKEGKVRCRKILVRERLHSWQVVEAKWDGPESIAKGSKREGCREGPIRMAGTDRGKTLLSFAREVRQKVIDLKARMERAQALVLQAEMLAYAEAERETV